jgi:ribosomal protein L11 methyltransferase
MDGLDIDPQALDATQANALNNDISNSRYRVMLDDRDLEPQYDLVVANILAGPLCDLAHSICQRVKPKGRLALSGILAHQADVVRAAYEPWVDFQPQASHDGWVRLNGYRNTRSN